MSLLTTTLILFLIMDSVGNIPSFLSLVNEIPRKQQRKIIWREMFVALGIMLLFNFFGEYLFTLLSIDEITVRLASGVILFLIAVKILFPTTDSIRANLPHGEPVIFPLAVPLIAGPALLATILLFAHMTTDSTMIIAICIAWALSLIVLFSSNFLYKVLTRNGLLAIERLLAMVLVLLAIQRFMEGLTLFFKEYG